MSVAIISFTVSLAIQFMRMPVHCEGIIHILLREFKSDYHDNCLLPSWWHI